MTDAFLSMDSITDSRDIYFGFQLRMPGAAPSLSALRAQVGCRITALPALTHIPVRHNGRTVWEPSSEFDLDAHVVAGPPLPDVGFHPAATLFADPPDQIGPLWRMWLLPGSENTWSVCYLAHHAVQDVTGALDTLTTLFGQSCEKVTGTTPRPGKLAGIACLPGLFADYSRISGPPASLETGRRAACAGVPLERVRVIARETGATVNQVYLAALSIALHAWAPAHWRHAGRPGVISALIPVDTRLDAEPRGGLGNRIGLLRIQLPLADSDPERVLRTVARRAGRGRIARHRRSFRVAMDTGPRWPARWILRRIGAPGTAAMTISNVAQQMSLAVCGTDVAAIEAVPWLPPNQDCFAFLTGYRDRATLSVLTRGTAADPHGLASGWVDAVELMFAHVTD